MQQRDADRCKLEVSETQITQLQVSYSQQELHALNCMLSASPYGVGRVLQQRWGSLLFALLHPVSSSHHLTDYPDDL